MLQKVHIILMKLLAVLTVCHAANILICLPHSSKSHYIMFRPIGLELAKRGHNVTVIAPYKEDVLPDNYHQITIDELKIWNAADKYLGTSHSSHISRYPLSMIVLANILWYGGLKITEDALKNKNVQEFLNKDNHFDIVINEVLSQEAFYALAHKYNAHQVLISTLSNSVVNNYIMRNPMQLATVLFECIEIKKPKTFFGRLRNFYSTLFYLYFSQNWYLEKQEMLAKKYIKNFPSPMPALYDINKNASIFLLNSYFTDDTPKALLPNIIEIGGLHIKEIDNQTSKLPDDLKKILDDAKNGIVYVNFGTNMLSTYLPEDKRKTYFDVFKKLKQTVIMKWENDYLEGKPKNVITRKWLPQVEILAHPNVKVFISHGGRLGTQEAIFYGVPIIGMPMYADQYNNILKVQEAGHGKILDYGDLNEVNLGNALNEVLNNDAYMKKAKEMQARFKDRPTPPLETAIFWIEYVIRNKGAHFLKNPAMDMSWLEYTMLDVYAFIVITTILMLILISKLLICILGLLFKKRPRELPSVIRKNK